MEGEFSFEPLEFVVLEDDFKRRKKNAPTVEVSPDLFCPFLSKQQSIRRVKQYRAMVAFQEDEPSPENTATFRSIPPGPSAAKPNERNRSSIDRGRRPASSAGILVRYFVLTPFSNGRRTFLERVFFSDSQAFCPPLGYVAVHFYSGILYVFLHELFQGAFVSLRVPLVHFLPGAL